jgi:hypothetical protein
MTNDCEVMKREMTKEQVSGCAEAAWKDEKNEKEGGGRKEVRYKLKYKPRSV